MKKIAALALSLFLTYGTAFADTPKDTPKDADAQADEFGPAQTGKRQDRDDVALVAACHCQGGDFRGREVTVAFSRGYAAR